jgi:hypothetical protein
MQPAEPEATPPRRSWPRRHKIATALLSAVVLIIVVVIAASAGVRHGSGTGASPAAPVPSPAAAAPAPAPTASPAGTGSGSCDYTLGDNPAGSPGTAVATGEIDLTNTGNVGITVKATVAWPQEGYAPLTLTKTARVPFGASGQPVSFALPLTYDQITNLQNWEEGHSFPANDCTYTEDITGTYGRVH